MVELSSKELVKGLFSGKQLPRPPFIPWVCAFAARLEQVSVQDMLSEPGLLSRACLNAQELLGYDAITTVFDTTLEAEACGCEVEWSDDESLPKVVGHPLAGGAPVAIIDAGAFDRKGRIPAVIESTKRLKLIRGKQVALVAVVTGPVTLASHLKGDGFLDEYNHGSDEAKQTVAAAADIILRLSRRYCELGVDAIAVAEESFAGVGADGRQHLAGLLKSLWNVFKFYGANSLVLTRGCHAEHLEPLLSMKADGVAVAGDFDGRLLKDLAEGANVRFSRSIPLSELAQDSVTEQVRHLMSSQDRNSFLSTEWDVPYTTSVAAMQEIMAALTNGS